MFLKEWILYCLSGHIARTERKQTTLLVDFKFSCEENAHDVYFSSFKLNVHVVTKIKTDVNEWNVNGQKGKMYALP